MKGGASLSADDFTDFGFPVLHKGSIQPGGRLSFDREGKMHTSEAFVRANQNAVVDDRYVVATLRNLVRTGETLGFVASVPEGRRFLLAQGAYGLRLDPDRLDSRYLSHLSNAPVFHSEVLRRMVGTTQVHIRNGDFLAVPIPLPSMPEQRRIAEILDKADALRASRRAALATLDTLARSIFLDMFGDPAGNPKAWPTRKLEHVADIISGATPRTDNDAFWNGDVNWITPKELSALEGMYVGETERRITRKGLESCGASVLPSGSVLFSSRAPIGYAAICSVPMATNQGFKSFVPRPDVLDPHFLLFWLRLRRLFLEGLGTGATFKEVSKAVVARVSICVPPIDLQVQFARHVIALERIRSLQCTERGQLDALFASIQHRAFRGEL